MIYRLVDILEDIDFGCEEREGELPLMAVAVLEDPDNNKIRFKMPDALFTKRGRQAGDSVYIDEDDTLRKAITSPDWTKEFGSKDIDGFGERQSGGIPIAAHSGSEQYGQDGEITDVCLFFHAYDLIFSVF